MASAGIGVLASGRAPWRCARPVLVGASPRAVGRFCHERLLGRVDDLLDLAPLRGLPIETMHSPTVLAWCAPCE